MTVPRIQGTRAWKMRRCGKATGSRIYDIVATKRNGEPTAAYGKYLEQLAVERATGVIEDGFVSQAMADGTRKEPEARTLYAFETGQDVEEIEFIDHPSIPNAGASPDGIMRSSRKFIEIKCPLLTTFVSYRNSGEIPPNYLCQIGWLFACMPEMESCDYVVYSDDVAYAERLMIKTVPRRAKFIATLEAKVMEFNAKVDERADAIRSEIERSV